jgi:hypothetical protein
MWCKAALNKVWHFATSCVIVMVEREVKVDANFAGTDVGEYR